MKWYSCKTHMPPSNAGECIVATSSRDLWIATFRYYESEDDYLWVADHDGEPLNTVTHFCIIDPLPINEEVK